MRISDWSSRVLFRSLPRYIISEELTKARDIIQARIGARVGQHHQPRLHAQCHAIRHPGFPPPCLWAADPLYRPTSNTDRGSLTPRAARSEEHTSELQSLMRISYAVFCLKQKNHSRLIFYTPIHR